MGPSQQPAETASAPTSLPPGTDMLSTFLSLMPDAAVAVDLNGTIVAVNERTEAFFGYTGGELEGKFIELLVPERFRHSHRTDRAGYSAEPRARPMGAGIDLYARRKDGTEFPVDISLAPIGDNDSPLVVAAVRDITERKAAQSAQAQLAAIVQSSADAIFSMTHRGLITSWNPAAEVMFGYQAPQVVGHHIGQFFADDAILEELLDAAQSARTTPSHDTRWHKRDGTTIDVAISVSLLADTDEPGYSLLVRDITVRKAAEAQLRRQARWQTATAEIRLGLLSEAPLESSLGLVCKWAADLSGARAAAVMIAKDGRRRLAAKSGQSDALAVLGRHLNGLSGLARNQPKALVPGLEVNSFPISFPTGDGALSGALVVVDEEGTRLGADQDEILDSLASQSILAFELASVRAERDRLLISADRERIARDLHDLVIQRLFGAGLRLQGALGLIDNQAATARVSSTIDDLDATIKEIREAIFALESDPGTGLRAKVLEEVADAAEALGFRPVVSFHGPTDREVALQVQLEATAVLREALSNSARHAHASRVDVHITVDDDVGVLVADNGIGVGHPEHLSGIANARARAELLGGSLHVSPTDSGGTCFDWRVPISPAPAEGPEE
jgi:PAS domain S-box-containing protein